MNKKEKLIIWGNGKAKREIIYVDDLADHIFMKKTKESLINIGTGKDFSIKQYADKILSHILQEKNINQI